MPEHDAIPSNANSSGHASDGQSVVFVLGVFRPLHTLDSASELYSPASEREMAQEAILRRTKMILLEKRQPN